MKPHGDWGEGAHLLELGTRRGASLTPSPSSSVLRACSLAARQVFLIPGDTFRAAASEQLAEWCRRSNAVMGEFTEGSSPQVTIERVRNDTGWCRGDGRRRSKRCPCRPGRACLLPLPYPQLSPAPRHRRPQCLEDAMSRKGDAAIDLVICDTAGRLHTAYALMEELEACKKAIGTAVGGQPDETLLVVDGTTGLNMLNQVSCGEGRGVLRAAGRGRDAREGAPLGMQATARDAWLPLLTSAARLLLARSVSVVDRLRRGSSTRRSS